MYKFRALKATCPTEQYIKTELLQNSQVYPCDILWARTIPPCILMQASLLPYRVSTPSYMCPVFIELTSVRASCGSYIKEKDFISVTVNICIVVLFAVKMKKVIFAGCYSSKCLSNVNTKVLNISKDIKRSR